MADENIAGASNLITFRQLLAALNQSQDNFQLEGTQFKTLEHAVQPQNFIGKICLYEVNFLN